MLGKVELYTGDGKGKTTAAFGLALRALGHGYRVLVIQFMKGSSRYGELKSASRLRGLRIVRFGKKSHVKKGAATRKDLDEASKAVRSAREALRGGRFDIVILDEVNVAVDYGLVPVGDVLELIRNKNPKVELVLTGRYAHPSLIEAADLVSEMREIKHYYRQGVKARRGIEY